MANQTSLRDAPSHAGINGNANGSSKVSPESRLVSGISDFTNDIVSLADLQLQLASHDLKECIARALIPVAVVAVGFILILGSLPVAIFGVAEFVAEAFKIQQPLALVLTGGGLLLFAIVAILIAVTKLSPSISSFRRTREELSRNIAWIRTVLLYSGRNLPRRTR